MACGNREEGAGVVVETGGVVEACGFRRHLSEAAHAFRGIVEPPGRTQLEAGVMARERRQLARICTFIEREEDDREFRLVTEAIEQGLQRTDIVGPLRDIAALVAPEALMKPAVVVPERSRMDLHH